MRLFLPACLAGLLLASGPGFAEDAMPAASGQASAGDLRITGGWVRAMLPGQKNGAGYLTVSNGGTSPDRLLSAASPEVPRLEVHSMQVENDVMTMRPVEGGLEIPAGGAVQLAPGGYHLMLLGLPQPLQEGGSVDVELRFQHAGTVRVALPVRRPGGDGM